MITTVATAARHYSLNRFRPPLSGIAWSIVGLLMIFTAGCGRDAGEIDSRLVATDSSTITGTVRGPEGRSPADGRAVEVVNIESGERLRGSTNTTGGFSFRVKRGKYRIVLALRDGESLVREPGIIDLNRSDAAVHADFVLGNVRLTRPRGPSYRADDGLGSPIA
ncbi:MAG: carboxypeptidase-like regulatory domain-containing protein [Vicinamibacterales bacterium]